MEEIDNLISQDLSKLIKKHKEDERIKFRKKLLQDVVESFAHNNKTLAKIPIWQFIPQCLKDEARILTEQVADLLSLFSLVEEYGEFNLLYATFTTSKIVLDKYIKNEKEKLERSVKNENIAMTLGFLSVVAVTLGIIAHSYGVF